MLRRLVALLLLATVHVHEHRLCRASRKPVLDNKTSDEAVSGGRAPLKAATTMTSMPVTIDWKRLLPQHLESVWQKDLLADALQEMRSELEHIKEESISLAMMVGFMDLPTLTLTARSLERISFRNLSGTLRFTICPLEHTYRRVLLTHDTYKELQHPRSNWFVFLENIVAFWSTMLCLVIAVVLPSTYCWKVLLQYRR